MNNSSTYRVSIKSIIKDTNWDVLLMYNDKYETWNMPWWWLKHWEDIINCIKREIKEELWLNIADIGNSPICFITSDKGLNKEMPWIWNLCYQVEVENLNFTKSNECKKIWFFNQNNIKSVTTPENVELIFNHIFKWK